MKTIPLAINYQGDEFTGEAIPQQPLSSEPAFRVYLYGNDIGLIIKNNGADWQGSKQMDNDLAKAIGRAIDEQTEWSS